MKSVQKLHLAPGLDLPAAEVACEVTAALGNRGGGKTNGAVLFVEQLCDAGVPVVVLDYVGIWFGLRLGPDGKKPSRYEVPVLGGRHGDVALAPTAGAVVAEALAERQSSAVIDLSLFSKSDRCRFATDFAEAFFRAKKKHPGPVQLVLEEAQRFVPQVVYKGQERMLGAFEEIAEVGRNFGVGMMLISQRPQKLSKDVLNLADTVFAYRTIGTHERKAIGEWVREKGAVDRREVADELPSLSTGTAVVWCPSRGIYGCYAICKKTTYDAGATPLVARESVVTSPLDLEALVKAMGRAAEEARAADPRELRAELAKAVETRKMWEARAVSLQGELDVARRVSAQESKCEVVPRKLVGVLEGAVAELRRVHEAVGKLLVKLEGACGLRALQPGGEDGGGSGRPRATESRSSSAGTLTERSRQDAGGESTVLRSAAQLARARDRGVGQGELSVLRAVAQYPDGIAREELTILTGYKRSSRDTYLQRLKALGLVEPRGSLVVVAAAGRDLLGDDFEQLPTGRRLYDYWMSRLSAGEAAILRSVVSSHPARVSKSDLLGRLPYKRSSQDTYLQRLRARRLVTVIGGEVAASDLLFDSNAVGDDRPYGQVFGYDG